ncbi:MAG: FtsW/RodA/SpoVE family cell cycle protein [Anaerolineae bacterium]|nr:FtsW/RodA/SpoVE family cell cycle protein [Anaerolineae bacterium]
MALVVGISALPPHLGWLQRYRFSWLVGGLGLLLATILLGVNPSGGGPRLWLGGGRVFFQPSELLKVILVVFLASYLAEAQGVMRQKWRARVPSLRYLGPIFLMWGICMVVLVWQRDLGTATLFFMVFMLMLYVASGEVLLLLGGGGLLAWRRWGVTCSLMWSRCV